MKCPYCNHEEDKVVDSRTTREGKAIRRRRECLKCTRRYTTYEYIESVSRIVIKNDGRREPFDMGKLLAGIYTACKKRPVSQNKIQEIVDKVEAQIAQMYSDEVPSQRIGEFVMRSLQEVDEVAYMRFASVCRNFKEVSEFLNEIYELNGTSVSQISDAGH